jgi:hypothetical protein
MSILKSVAAILQGMGPAAARGAIFSIATPAAANTFTFTFNQPLNCGYCRIQAKGFTGGGGFVSLALRGYDGTNYWDLGYVEPSEAGAAGDFISIMVPFITDVALTQIVAILTLTAATTGGTPAGGNLDGEVWGALM